MPIRIEPLIQQMRMGVEQPALWKLYEQQILPAIPKGLCGAVYTQLSDVEEERNGLISYDRKRPKVDAPLFLRIRAAIDGALS